MEEKKTRRSGRGIVSRKAFSPEPEPVKERKKSENSLDRDPKKPVPKKPKSDRKDVKEETQSPQKSAVFSNVFHSRFLDDEKDEEIDVVTVDGKKDSVSAALGHPDVVDIGQDGLVYMSEKHPELVGSVLNMGQVVNNREELIITISKGIPENCCQTGNPGVLIKKAEAVSAEFVEALNRIPMQYYPARESIDDLMKSSAMTIDLFSNYSPHIDVLHILKQQNSMEEKFGFSVFGDAIVHLFSVYHARQLIEVAVFSNELARCHTWLMYKLRPKELRSYLILCKFVFSLDCRWGFFFASDPKNAAFTITNAFIYDLVCDPYAGLILNLTASESLAGTKPTVIFSFNGIPDDKLGTLGMLSRGFYSAGCNIISIGTTEDKQINFFIKTFKSTLSDPGNAIIFLAKIFFEPFYTSQKFGSCCLFPKIEFSFIGENKNKDSRTVIRTIVFSFRNIHGQLLQYDDLAYNGLTPACLTRTVLERAMIFMNEFIPPVMLINL